MIIWMLIMVTKIETQTRHKIIINRVKFQVQSANGGNDDDDDDDADYEDDDGNDDYHSSHVSGDERVQRARVQS